MSIGSETKLLNLFGDLIAYGTATGLKIRDGREAPISVEKIRAEALQAIDHAKSTAEKAARSEPEIENGLFPIVAWIDELLATTPGAGKDYEPIQIKMYNTHNAGNEFFVRLQKLTQDQIEIREIYYVILCLGFVGRYFRLGEDSPELIALKQKLAEQCSFTQFGSVGSFVEYLTPQPYSVTEAGEVWTPFEWRKYLPYGVAGALASLAAIVLIYFYTKPQTPTSVQNELEKLLAKFSCSMIDVAVDQNRNAELSGFVSQADFLQTIEQEAKAVEDVGAVKLKLATHKWPICEVLMIVSPYKGSSRTASLQLNDATVEIREGNRLVLEATVPDFDAFVFVDLVDPEGTVVHMMPNPVEQKNFRPARNSFVIGRSPGKRYYEIVAPFGEHVAIMIASQKPLFDELRPEVEKAEEYLPILWNRLQSMQAANEANELEVVYLLLMTEESSN